MPAAVSANEMAVRPKHSCGSFSYRGALVDRSVIERAKQILGR